MALKIYGVAMSRAFRTMWMAEELEIDYELIETNSDEQFEAPELEGQ